MTRGALTGFAVDFGGSKITAARIEAGRIGARRTGATDRTGNLDQQLDHMAALLRQTGYETGARLGVAVTGLVSRGGRWSAVNAATLPAIRDAPLRDALEARFGNATCRNDALAATLAEARFGAGRGCRDFAYITVSTGVGGGLLLNGAPVTGRQGLAGHFGFATTSQGDALCGSGRTGTVESVASGLAIARHAAEAGHGGLAAKEVFAAAARGADWADRIVERSAGAIAGLIGDIAAMVDPDRIAIGGSVGLAPGYIDRVGRHLRAEPARFRPEVVAARLGHDGPLLGALAEVPPP